MDFSNFAELLAKNSRKYQDRAAIVYATHNDKQTITWGEFGEAVRTKAERFQRLPYDSVAMYAQSSPAWILHMFASVISGKRTVLLDPLIPTEEVEKIIDELKIQFLYCDMPAKAAALRPALQKNIDARTENGPEDPIECGGKLLFYTSGTTDHGMPVILSQQALLRSAWNGQVMLPCHRQDVVLSILPLFHVFGFICSMLWPFTRGATVAIGRGIRFLAADPAFFRPSILPVVPSLMKYLLQVGTINENLRVMLVGGGPAEREFMEAVQKKGIEVRFGYGLTETASGLAISTREGDPMAMALCPDTRIRIAEDGELFVKTACMMDGYYHMPDKTEEVLSDGELATGDLVELSDDGKLLIRGRKNDVLVFDSGEKIYCPQWERKLAQQTGTQVALTLRNGELTLVAVGGSGYLELVQKEIDEFNEKQPEHLRIVHVEMRDEPFPRTVTGKLRRWLL